MRRERKRPDEIRGERTRLDEKTRELKEMRRDPRRTDEKC